MDAQEQLVERELAVLRHDDLTVEHEALRADAAKRLDEIREVAREGLSRLGHHIDLVAVAKGETAEAIPLRLVLPGRAGRQAVDELRLHRRIALRDGERHRTRSRRK